MTKKILIMFFLFFSKAFSFDEFVNPNPSIGDNYGYRILVLSNGNIVITAPYADIDGYTNNGAVYLYNGSTKALISTLKGSHNNDYVGMGSVIELTDGNFITSTAYWSGNRGAVTWGNASTGFGASSVVLSSSNSLVGSTANDQVSSANIYALADGRYLVRSDYWNNGLATAAGAVTICSANGLTVGNVSTSNSLVGSNSNDNVGSPTGSPLVLGNGKVIVASPWWDNGLADVGAVTMIDPAAPITGTINSGNSFIGTHASDALGLGGINALNSRYFIIRSYMWNGTMGAVTWVDGSGSLTGTLTSGNSLVGSTAGDQIGYWHPKILSSGNYVLRAPDWDNGSAVNAGAVIWGSLTAGVTGAVGAGNALVGSQNEDRIGNVDIVVLTNGNYVASSGYWNNGLLTYAGCATWGSGTTGVKGTVSASNSIIGLKEEDRIAWNGTPVVALTNGNFVVVSSYWDNGTTLNVGAVTWGDGINGTVGGVTAANSLVGTSTNDNVGSNEVIPLTNGNYVVCSANWDNGVKTNAGAATWCNGSTGSFGAVTTENSLVGDYTNAYVSYNHAVALSDGNYVVLSSIWTDGVTLNLGAATWCDGSLSTTGTVNVSNSLIGSYSGDRIGYGGATALPNGKYIIQSQAWTGGVGTNLGAVTLCNGGGITSGVVTSSNSLVGVSNNDLVGNGGIKVFSNGNYLVKSSNWDNGVISDVGALTWGSATSGVTGAVSSSNSLFGGSANDNIGNSRITEISGDRFIASYYTYDNGAATDAGYVVFGSTNSSTIGNLPTANTLEGNGTNAYLSYVASNSIYSDYYFSEYASGTLGKVFSINSSAMMFTPTVQSTNVNFTNLATTSLTINWTNGDGAKRAVFIKQASTGTAAPSDNITYTANTVFSSGTQIDESGWYCVYNGIGTSVDVTGLTSFTQYIVHVVEFNGSTGGENYLTSSSTNNPNTFTTYASEPTNHVTNFNYTNRTINSVDITWTDAIGAIVPEYYLIKASTVDYSDIISPVDETPESNSLLVKNDTHVGGLNSVTFNGLISGTRYYFKIYPYRATGSYVNYKTDGIVPSVVCTTLVDYPTIQTSNIYFSNVARTSMTLNWTRGNGHGILALCKNSAITSTPLNDYQVYGANGNYTSGDPIDGGFCIYNGVGTSVPVTGLTKYKLYYFRLFEYKNSPQGGPVYLQSSNSTNPSSRWTLRKDGDDPSLNTGSEFSIYPNPTTDIINYSFEIPESVNVTTELYTSDGRLVKSVNHGALLAGEQKLSLNVNDLTNGVYTLQIRIGEEMIVGIVEIVR